MTIRRLALTASALALSTGVLAQPAHDGPALEAAFDAAISAQDQQQWMERMASAPNHVGSAHDKANAEFIRDQYASFGWDAKIETFTVLFPTPVSTTVEMIAPEAVKLGGQEPQLAEDPTSGHPGMLPPYVAYQGDGDVTGDLVYVNQGMPDDYEDLARRGIDVKGKIVIARYGGGWRGLKPKLAQDHGAIGCIIYSDPADDGYAQGDVYPKGATRPPFGVQRGSVMDMAIHPGDPLTPGIGSSPGARRIPRAQADTILKIVALPMSYGDAQKLLQRMGGPAAPEDWRGGLPLTYHIGGDGAVKVHLSVKSDWKQTPLYNVVAMLKGAKEPDSWVMRGNHHDGWVFGAADPLSGNVAMMSEAKGLGALYKQGWRPDRTIVYLSWDGEEEGLLGSTEWAEEHAAELKKKALLYVNTDGNERGFLGGAGTHSWQHLFNDVAKGVRDPQTGATVWERNRARVLANSFDKTGNFSAEMQAAAKSGADLPIGPLGSGSDYTGFLQHLGIASLNLGFGGEGEDAGGVYHSIYDSYHHFSTFQDPGFAYGAALSKVAGRLVIRAAQAPTPPVRFTDFADTVAMYLAELGKLEGDRREQDITRAKLTADGSFRLAADPKHMVNAPTAMAATPHVELAALANAVDRLKAAASAYDAAYARQGAALAPAARTKLNGLLNDIDQTMLDDKGLPGRPWFKNLVYAPGRFTGYGAKTLPGVREAIEERRFDDANEYAGRTAKVLTAYAVRLEQARAVVEGR